MGFKDGTANLKAEESTTGEAVWVAKGDDPGADWLAGGSYLVARKIRMLIEDWDHQQLGEQERVFGRDKGEGAPLSGGTEFTPLDLDSVGPAGRPAIDPAAHVRLAHSSTNGAVILRRGFNFVDGNDDLGRLSAGLFFIAFGRSPAQFIAVQRALAGHDALNEYIKHVGSGVWAVPPGASPGGFVGETLFA